MNNIAKKKNENKRQDEKNERKHVKEGRKDRKEDSKVNFITEKCIFVIMLTEVIFQHVSSIECGISVSRIYEYLVVCLRAVSLL